MILVWLGLMLSLSQVHAQSGVTRVKPEIAFVGAPITVSYEFEISKTQKDSLVHYKSPLAAIRSSLKSESPDTVRIKLLGTELVKTEKIQGRWYLKLSQQLMVLDTGYLVLSPRTVQFADEELLTSPSLLRVDFVPKKNQVPFEDIQEEYADLPEEPFSLTSFVEQYWPWILLLIGVGALVLIWLKKSKIEQSISRSPIEQALYDLEQLRLMPIQTDEDLKNYFARQTQILKKYLEGSRGWRALDKSSSELILLLRASGESEDHLERWKYFLNTADLIKFARGKGSQALVESMHQQTIELLTKDSQG